MLLIFKRTIRWWRFFFSLFLHYIFHSKRTYTHYIINYNINITLSAVEYLRVGIQIFFRELIYYIHGRCLPCIYNIHSKTHWTQNNFLIMFLSNLIRVKSLITKITENNIFEGIWHNIDFLSVVLKQFKIHLSLHNIIFIFKTR